MRGFDSSEAFLAKYPNQWSDPEHLLADAVNMRLNDLHNRRAQLNARCINYFDQRRPLTVDPAEDQNNLRESPSISLDSIDSGIMNRVAGQAPTQTNVEQRSRERLEGQNTARRIHTIPEASQPPPLDEQDIHPMFSYVSRTLRALLLMQGPLFITGFRQQIEQEHMLTMDERIHLSEQYRNVTNYAEFCELLFGVHDTNGIKKSNYIPYWRTVDIDGNDDTRAATNQHKAYLQTIINSHGPLAYIDKIAATLTVLGLEPHFYAESQVNSWTK